MEIWKEVKDTRGQILVSNYGRVKSLLRSGTVLKSQADKKGYLRVSVTLDKVKRTYKVHRLVADAFLENPYGLPQVNHKDGDKTNNTVENLEWISNRDNCLHAIKNGLWTSVFEGAAKENAKRMRPVIAIKDDVKMHFKSVSDAERAFKSRHISDVLKGKRAQVKGWKFLYSEEVMA